MNVSSKCCSRCGRPQGITLRGTVCAACRLRDVLADEGEPATEVESGALDQDFPILQRFGPYELLEEIGRGGMGVVYRARQPIVGRVVALKMLLAGEFAEPKSRERLLREARVAARLNHPGIITIYDVGEHEGRPYFAMELVPGRNLAELCRDGLLPLDTVVRYVEQLAGAVHYAHQHGVIHRDLKPANILITPDDEPKLTDFGLTKSLVDPTRTVESAGSPNYMAPEQADRSVGNTGTATDVFGLGAILYHLLTGRPPAMGATLAETLQAVILGEPMPPRQLRPALPRDLETIALKCLEKDPGRRYGSALEVAEELARWRNHEPIRARPAGPAERITKSIRRRPLVAALVAAVFLSLLGGILMTSRETRKATEAARIAQTNEFRARKAAYLAEFQNINELYHRGEARDVRLLLERLVPGPGEPDLRGWEWRYLWGVSRSDAIPFVEQFPKRIRSIAVLPDGKTLAVGREESGLELWDAETGRRTLNYADGINAVLDEAHPAGNVVSCRVAVIPGRDLLAYTDCQRTDSAFVRLWNFKTRQIVRSLPLPHMPRHLAVSPDGAVVACGTMSGDGRVFFFNSDTGESLQVIKTVPSNFSAGNTLQFSPDGESILIEDTDLSLPATARAIVRVFDWKRGRDLQRFEVGQDYALTASFSPDGRWVAIRGGFNQSTVHVWEMPSGKLHATVLAGDFSLVWDSDHQRLWSGVQSWKIPSFSPDLEYRGDGPESYAAVLLPGDTTLITSDGNRLLKWDLTRKPIVRKGTVLDLDVLDHCFQSDDRSMALVGTNGFLHVAEDPDWKVRKIEAVEGGCVTVDSIPELGQIIVGRQDGTLSVHAPGTWARVGTLRTGHPTILMAKWIRPHQVLAVLCGTNLLQPWVQAWDVSQSRLLWETRAREGSRGITRSDHDGILYQVFVDHLMGYDLVRHREVRHNLDFTNAGQVAFSPDGALMFSTLRGAKRLVSLSNWRTIDTLPLIDGVVHGAAFWPGEPRMAAGFRIVDLASRRQLMTVTPDFGFGTRTFVSAGGSILGIRADAHPRIEVWRAPSWEEIRETEETDPVSH